MQRRLEEWLERCLEKNFEGGLEGSFVWGLDGRLEDYLEWVLERGVERGFSVLNKYEVWTLHGAISIRKGRFLKLVPRLGPEGTRLSLKTWKGCEDNGARRGTDTKGTQLSAETAKG